MPTNNVYVVSEATKDELIKRGYQLVEETKAVNGETVWVLNPHGLSFDISADLPGIALGKAFRLNF